MADSFVQVPADGAGKKINSYTDANGEHNQTAVLVDQNGNPIIAATTTPGGSDMGLVVRLAGTGAVSLAAGSVIVANPTPSTTSTLANKVASATVITLQALNTNRLGWVCYNDSSSAMYIKFGSAASLTSFTYKLQAGQLLEIFTNPVYTGIITGIWDTATGNARVTELTA